ncbi:hypothetical protein FGG08_002409 [Glutinoglossum americanum]|uniref:Choline kinase N-terminal domain-containing protein n=1 Tax=Glutinoglossum americanum TaxID=1670608 RepID=A0A9P8KZ68_9PEZI|nr:hypothetical protein FGG08_002409 [Glutinoglossum americanum]
MGLAQSVNTDKHFVGHSGFDLGNPNKVAERAYKRWLKLNPSNLALFALRWMMTPGYQSPAARKLIMAYLVNRTFVAISEPEPSGSRGSQHFQGGLAAQVLDWLQEERARRASRKEKQREGESSDQELVGHHRKTSDSSEGSDTLDKLEQILAENAIFSSRAQSARSTPRLFAVDHRGSVSSSHHSSSFRKLRRPSTAASSDTDYQDGDAIVPSCDTILDNSKTLSYTGGAGCLDTDSSSQGRLSKQAQKERESWDFFKNEIVRLTHTLKLKGWRRVPLGCGREIGVERISGALTNAVYMVSPPKNMPPPKAGPADSAASPMPTKPPPKLLLRIYGPQVEHLIDRETELQVLQRLARKRIGPRLLGTFTNGRFEEFFYAQTLTCQDLPSPDTSKQIAKRMRELHDGIELLKEERDAGPNVWKNWDKWVERSEQVISWVDRIVTLGPQGPKWPKLGAWKDRGLVCGVEWSVFRRAVEHYREWLNEKYGGAEAVKQLLVFAHNDTQYGNILRLQPSGESPLLLPANEHKQLVVIDFEYAAANLPGLEFANHFTEWCYNYHDPEKPYALNEARFPKLSEQRTFIKAYVEHRSAHHHSGPTPGSRTPGSISTFTLDARGPPSQAAEDEDKRDKETDREIERLLRDARLWRAANSAQWVAWGIVQAHLPEINGDLPTPDRMNRGRGENSQIPTTRVSIGTEEMALNNASEEDNLNLDVEDEDEFDYLAYAQERAMFFWGDLLYLGVISPHELPPQLLLKLKMVNY